MRKTTLAGLSVVVALGLVATALPTAAAAKPVKSEVKMFALGVIAPNGNYGYAFAAVVRTHGDKRCKGGRKVSFLRREPGPDTLIGADRTDFLGEAAFVWRRPPLDSITGDYYASVKQAVKKKGRGTRKCLADKSPTFSLTAPNFT